MPLQYYPLNDERKEMRLMRFHPRSVEQPDHLNLSLETISLLYNSDYHCLSYVWGSEDLVFPVIVNGHEVKVTQSLGEALQRLEKEKDIKALWADGLCIHQKDTKERIAQVKLMETIYSSASGVFAWLGTADESTDYVMKELKSVGAKMLSQAYISEVLETLKYSVKNAETEIVQMMESCVYFASKLGHEEDLSKLPGPLSQRSVMAAALQRLRSMSVTQRHLNDFVDYMQWRDQETLDRSVDYYSRFLNRSFWSRVWIVQELCLAKEVTLVCGEQMTRIEFLWAIMQCYAYMPLPPLIAADVSPVSGVLFTPDKCLNGVRRHMMSEEKAPITELFHNYSELHAKIPLDKVYGLSGITSDSKEIAELVDYNKTPEQLAEDVMKMALIKYGTTELRTKFVYPKTSTSPKWPSWISSIGEYLVPSNEHELRIEVALDKRGEIRFCASGTIKPLLTDTNFPSPGIFSCPCTMVSEVDEVLELSKRKWEYSKHSDSAYEDAIRTTVQEMIQFYNIADLSEMTTYEPKRPYFWVACGMEDPAAGLESDLARLSLEAANYGAQYAALLTGEPTNSSLWQEAMLRMSIWMACNSPFKAKNGFVGRGPMTMQKGDLVVVIHGANVPFVVRKMESGRYSILGDAYVLGIMHGEFMNGDVEERVLEFE